MKKETIEVARFEKCQKGYGWLTAPKEISDTSILNKLCEWSKDKNVTIYDHVLVKREENLDKYPEPYSFKNSHFGPPTEIPYCDWVYYLDIWCQEKL